MKESVKIPDTHKVLCDDAIETLIAEIRGLSPPFEVRISPINELATAKQKGLWAVWMRTLEEETGGNRRELELGFLARYASQREYIGPNGIEFRAKAFAELTKEEARSIMTQVQAVAAEGAGIVLTSRADEWQ